MIKINIQNQDIEKRIAKIKTYTKEAHIERDFTHLLGDFGVDYDFREKLIKGVPDAIFPRIILDFKQPINENMAERIANSQLKRYANEYFTKYGEYPSLLVIFDGQKYYHFKIKDGKLILIAPPIESTTDTFLQFTEIVTANHYPLLDGENLRKYFGIYSPLFYWCIDELRKFFKENFEKIKHIYNQWQKDFEIAYNKEIEESEELFIRHTYLILLVKSILCKAFKEKLGFDNYRLLNSPKDLEDIINGVFLKRAGFPNLIECDYFSWLQYVDSKNKYDLLIKIFREIDKFDKIKHEDIFREIYQDLVTYKIRHSLGEYYTPSWLANLMVKEIGFKAGMRVLDPACGSGTFLIELIKEIFKQVEEPEKRLEAVKNIVGFDINNLAISIARANYLLSVYDLLVQCNVKEFEIPIYLTDSIFPIFKRELADPEYGEVMEYHMSSINKTINISTKIVENLDFFKKVIFILDDLLHKYDKLEKRDFIKKFKYEIKRNGIEEEANRKIEKYVQNKRVIDNLLYIAKTLYEINKNGENKIWLALMYNRIIPFLSRESFDLIIGNPPWIIYRNLPTNYGDRVYNLAQKMNIHTAPQNKTNYEIATLFFYQTAGLYLKEGGDIFFILTKGVIDGDHAMRFRKMKRFDDILIYDIKDQVFNTPCILWKATKRKNSGGISKDKKIPCKIVRNRNIVEKVNLVPIYVDDDFCGKFVTESEYNYLPKREKSFYYDGVISGAYLSPAIFFFVEEKRFGLKSFFQVEKQAYNNTKTPWIYYRDKITQDLNDFYSKFSEDLKNYKNKVISASCISPFEVKTKRYALLPIYRRKHSISIKRIDNINYAYNEWIKKLNEYWEKYKVSDRVGDIFENIDYYGKLTNKNQIKPYKVVFTRSGKMESAVVKGEDVIIDNTLHYYGTDNKDEAYYLSAIFNSDKISKIANIIKSERDICKKVLEFKIPQYNPSNKHHKKLAELGEVCHKKLEYKESIDKEIEEINKLVESIWS